MNDRARGGEKARPLLSWGALILGIIIMIGGVYAIIWGITPVEGSDEEESISQGGGCMLVLGLVFMAIGALFVTFFLRKRKADAPAANLKEGMKVCSKCNRRVEEDQELCYHCGYEFR